MVNEYNTIKTIEWQTNCRAITEVHLNEIVDDSKNSSRVAVGIVNRFGSNLGFVSTSPQTIEVYYNNVRISRGNTSRYYTPVEKGDLRTIDPSSVIADIPHNADGSLPAGKVKVKYIGRLTGASENDFDGRAPQWEHYCWNQGKNPFLYDPGTGRWSDDYNYWQNETLPVTEIEFDLHRTAHVYTLTTTIGLHSSMTVSRLSSGYVNAPIGTITNGAYIYEGDVIKQVCTADYHYEITSITINSFATQSGSSYVVQGNTAIVCVAELFVSRVTVGDTNLGSTTHITVTKYQPSDTHSIKITFGTIERYISADGSLSTTESTYTNTSLNITIPEYFGYEIPNDKVGNCTITCKSSFNSQYYERSSVFKIFVPDTYSPSVSHDYTKDVNPTTYALTRNEYRIVRYKSIVQTKGLVNSLAGATIASITVNGTPVTIQQGASTEIFIVDVPQVATRVFNIIATDSRGYQTTYGVEIDPDKWIPYIPLTCNPELSRDAPTSNNVYLSVYGNAFKGAFDANEQVQNTIEIKYRYREDTPSSVISTAIPCLENHIYMASTSYRSVADPTSPTQAIPIELYDDSTPSVPLSITYTKQYVFEITVSDKLSTVTRTLVLPRGVPVFDWGPDDFNINGELRIDNVNIFEYVFPIGSVYFSFTADTTQHLPPHIAALSGWVLDASSTAGQYIWLRTDPNANV